VRAEWNPYSGDEARVLPGRYGASYVREWGSLTTKIRGSYGRSTRPPGPEHKLEQIERDSYSINIFGPVVNRLANPDMTPEYQQGGEGGIEFYLGNRASLVVTRYNQTVDNLISEVNSIDSVRSLLPASVNNCGPYEGYDYCYYHQRQNLNVGSIRNQGWELQGSFSVGPLTTRGTYSYTKSRVIGVTPRYRELLAGLSFFTPGRSFDYLPEHTWAWGLTYAHARTSVGLAVTGVGQIYNTDNNFSLLTKGAHRVNHTRLRMDVPESYRPVSAGYMMSDLNVAQQLGRNIDATLQVHNLTDFYRSDASAEYATPGRQTQLGFRWRVN
jgi:outer membrane receptor protein involved in Fe transport